MPDDPSAEFGDPSLVLGDELRQASTVALLQTATNCGIITAIFHDGDGSGILYPRIGEPLPLRAISDERRVVRAMLLGYAAGGDEHVLTLVSELQNLRTRA